MVNDPYTVLGVTLGSDDAAIRTRYLALTQQYTPEQHPKEFTAIRAAYEAIRTFDDRVSLRLFPKPDHNALESILEELACQTPRPRIGLDSLFAVVIPAR